jgi:diguanylate cyclase (GGDEF)-like protein
MKDELINILVVDDIKENHLVMESVLTDPNLNIIKASSGEEALSLCTAHSFALILMDVQMPGMDGFETAEILRSIEKTKYTPIIFVTAISKEKASIFKGYEIGAIDYLFKPIDPIILKSKVQIFKDMYIQRRLIEKQAEELEARVRELTEIQEENEKLEVLSLEDPLTKIFNRRGIDKVSNMHWKNCIRYSLPMSIILLDLDRFKNYNDNYGHLEGDKVLIEIAKVLKEVVFRPEDLVGRFGGEEFICVLPNTKLDGAITVVERIQEVLAERNIIHEFNDNYGHVTLSAGVAVCKPSNQITYSQVLRIADEQLYNAKDAGRNCYRTITVD